MKRFALLAVLAACEDVPQPYDLDHARVMAVRIDPPAIAPGETATIEVLVSDPETAAPQLATDMTIDAPGARHTERGWEVTATEPGVVPLAIRVATPTGPLAATKLLAVGTRAENPAAPAITVNDAVGDIELATGTKATLAVTPADDTLVYRWFSSVGELTGFTKPVARVDPGEPGEGWIVVVVRDVTGGTAWTIAPATVR